MTIKLRFGIGTLFRGTMLLVGRGRGGLAAPGRKMDDGLIVQI